MIDEMVALHTNGTRDIVSLPSGKTIVNYCWVYTVKVGLDGQVDCLKACLVAKSYIHFLALTKVTPFPPLQDCFYSPTSLHGCYAFLATLLVQY